jgi:ATP adenylyltransferase
MFPNNPSIKPIDFTEQIIEDQNIKFNIKLLKILAKKPQGNRDFFSPLITKEKQVDKDPFVEPFENGAFIDEITDTHSLIFNKFSVCERHVIVITKDFMRQIDPLDIEDFKASIITMGSLNAFMFFNSGFNSGASIMHKHMQIIPYDSMDADYDGKTTFVPVEQEALKFIQENDLDKVGSFKLPQFSKFKHIFYRIDHDFFDRVNESEESADEMSEKLEQYYWECLKALGNEEHDNDISYNLVLTKNFLFVALRQVEAVKEDDQTVTVNSLGFVGTHAVKREEDLNLINKYSPIGILEMIS